MASTQLHPFSFREVDRSLFFSRNDASDIRFGDCAKVISPALLALTVDASVVSSMTSSSAAAVNASSSSQSRVGDSQTDLAGQNLIVGYPDDEGIQTNGGRVGAAKAPDTVRKYLYKMTPALLGSITKSNETPTPVLRDLGNLTNSMSLLERHQQAEAAASAALARGARWISIGGGHDYGYPDAAAYIQWAKGRGERPLILNFDAHLDVRSMERGLSSGTPFFRMLEAFPDVDFAEIGIQTQCNSQTHLKWAKERGARVLTQEEVLVSGESFCTQVLNLLGDWLMKRRSVFLSIDIDGFSSMAAPGCSQSWSTGFSPNEFFATLQVLIGRLDVRVLGVYEVSPPLDRDDQTSKLAAQIIHRVVSQ